ncbi:hypothetical protein Leryth_023571, partial [Lithospermum erythrorhizon]
YCCSWRKHGLLLIQLLTQLHGYVLLQLLILIEILSPLSYCSKKWKVTQGYRNQFL